MGILNTVKNKVGNYLAVDPPTLSISMMGPRAVGKTTVMASIFAQSQEGISGSNIYIRSGNASTTLLLGYKNLLSYAIEERNPAMLPASNSEVDILFELGMLDKDPTVRLIVKDFPGEYLTDVNNRTKVSSFMRDANIVLVAIDTPYLMEESGRYNEEKNQPTLVKEYIAMHDSEFHNKLILFVPLKCERYFHDERIEEVAQRVDETYGDLREYFKKNNIASIIAPILTLGGMEFDHMKENTSGMGAISKIATYRIYEKSPKYEPLFCAQPLYYLLSYVSAYYQWQQNQKTSIWDRFKSALNSYLTSDDEFRTEISRMYKFIIHDKFGYRIMTTNPIFNF